MSPVAGYVLEYGDAHGGLLAVSQVAVAFGEGLELLGIEGGDDGRVDGDQLVLLVPVADKPGAPAAIGALLEEKAEATIRLGVYLGPVNCKALCDGGLHLGDGTARVGRNVSRGAVDAVHDKGTLIHAGLRALDKVAPFHPPRPGCVYVGVVMDSDLSLYHMKQDKGMITLQNIYLELYCPDPVIC
jgi:hypothetical protein